MQLFLLLNLTQDIQQKEYEVQPILLPACAVGAPHRRDRIWFVAYNASYSNLYGQHECECDNEEQSSERRFNAFNDINENVEYWTSAYTKNIRQKYALENGELERRRFRQSNKRGFWNAFPSQSPICGGDDGLPVKLDGITFSKWRQESIKGYGNAIVPQVAYEIFKVIAEIDRLQKL